MSKLMRYNIISLTISGLAIANVVLIFLLAKGEMFAVGMSIMMPISLLVLAQWNKENIAKHYEIVNHYKSLAICMFFAVALTSFVLMILRIAKINFEKYLFQIVATPCHIFVILYQIIILKKTK